MAVSKKKRFEQQLQSTPAFRTPRYYGQELKSQGIRIIENNSRCYGLSLLRTPNCGRKGVRYSESRLYCD